MVKCEARIKFLADSTQASYNIDTSHFVETPIYTTFRCCGEKNHKGNHYCYGNTGDKKDFFIFWGNEHQELKRNENGTINTEL